MEEVIKILTPVAIGGLSAWIATKIALNKFYSEKWWEKKESAYVEIIDALYDLIQYCEIKKDDYGQGTGLRETREFKLIEDYNNAYWKIKKVTNIGAFVVSDEAASVLINLKNHPKLNWDENPSFEIYEQDYNFYKSALTEMTKVAKRDLHSSSNIFMKIFF